MLTYITYINNGLTKQLECLPGPDLWRVSPSQCPWQLVRARAQTSTRKWYVRILEERVWKKNIVNSLVNLYVWNLEEHVWKKIL